MSQPAKNNSKALLDGIKVLDLSRILAGPWATQMLADYGATVWKIEKPEEGDDTRKWGPPFVGDSEDLLSAYFMTANRGKKSVCIDISKPEGQSLIKRLVVKADILVENFKVGGLKAYGLDYKALSKINPGLIYCSITGFGQDGPSASAAGYDAMIQAAGGLMSITGSADIEGGQPQKVGVAVVDLMTGMYATTAILAALNYRHKTDLGQHIDLSLLDTSIAMLANQGLNYLVGGDIPQRQGNGHPNIVPYQTFATNDGHLMLAVGNDQQFEKLCKVIDLEYLFKDKKYQTNKNRVVNKHSLINLLTQKFQQDTQQNWLDKLTEINIPCGPINNIEQAFNHPQVKYREMQFDMMTENNKKIPQVANPVKFSQSELNYKLAPPILGSSTERVLIDDIGINLLDLQKLKQTGVI